MNWLRVGVWTVPLQLGLLQLGPLQLLAQLPPEGGEAPAGPAGAPGGQQGLGEVLLSPFTFMMMLFVLFFLLVLWPQQRQMRQQQKALAEALSNLKKNDRVITSGGIHGVVVQTSPEAGTVTIRIDEGSGTKMTVSREAIARVVTADGKASEAKNG